MSYFFYSQNLVYFYCPLKLAYIVINEDITHNSHFNPRSQRQTRAKRERSFWLVGCRGHKGFLFIGGADNDRAQGIDLNMELGHL